MTVQDCIRGALSVPADHPIDPEKSFADNGLDSMDVLQAIMALERDFGVKIEMADIEEDVSPAILERLVNERRGVAA